MNGWMDVGFLSGLPTRVSVVLHFSHVCVRTFTDSAGIVFCCDVNVHRRWEADVTRRWCMVIYWLVVVRHDWSLCGCEWLAGWMGAG